VPVLLVIDVRFMCRFYLCMWYKDDPHSKEKITYYLARLKSKEILRDSGNGLAITREWAKKICLTLGQKNSFSRGFDKILCLLLVCGCFLIFNIVQIQIKMFCSSYSVLFSG
jgi:hypothetical protein